MHFAYLDNFATKTCGVQRVLNPSCGEFFIGEVESIFEIFESDHESCWQSGCAVVVAVEWCVGFVESLPLDGVGELAEWVLEVEL